MPSARLTLLATLIVIIFAVTCNAAEQNGRIWGGEEAAAGAFPYAVSVRLDSVHACGGSIISETQILTAAHCVVQKDTTPVNIARLSVRVGSTNQFAGGKIVYVSEVIVHEDYAEENYKNNIAVIILANPLEWTEKIESIQIATTSAEEPPVNAEVTVSGWGELADNAVAYKLLRKTFTVTSDEDCKVAFKDSDASNICLAHNPKEGICTGDAGNGAIYNNKLVAISNFVVGACGSRYPDVFSNIAYYADWINSVTNI